MQKNMMKRYKKQAVKRKVWYSNKHLDVVKKRDKAKLMGSIMLDDQLFSVGFWQFIVF